MVPCNELLFPALPFVFSRSNTRSARTQIEWQQPEDNFNISSLPRSIFPHLENKNYKHIVPQPASPQFRTIDSDSENDEKILAKLLEIKVSRRIFTFWKFLLIPINREQEKESARTIWSKQSNDPNSNEPHYSPFLDKTLKLFNLQQVAFEIENSVMSKVSCTACKAGASLLQHYIKSGRSKEEIIKTIYQYCTNLQIQSPRVCEGVSNLFGVSRRVLQKLTSS